jgi:cytochrome c oxidase cbb3-type subunit 3
VSSASIYAQHDISPDMPSLSAKAGIGKGLWLKNCAFCHAADGSGQNWIGSFLEPPPRDLRDPQFMTGMTVDLLIQRIENGLVNTSMPAWKQVLSREQIGYIVSYISEAFHTVRE